MYIGNLCPDTLCPILLSVHSNTHNMITYQYSVGIFCHRSFIVPFHTITQKFYQEILDLRRFDNENFTDVQNFVIPRIERSLFDGIHLFEENETPRLLKFHDFIFKTVSFFLLSDLFIHSIFFIKCISNATVLSTQKR